MDEIQTGEPTADDAVVELADDAAQPVADVDPTADEADAQVEADVSESVTDQDPAA